MWVSDITALGAEVITVYAIRREASMGCSKVSIYAKIVVTNHFNLNSKFLVSRVLLMVPLYNKLNRQLTSSSNC